MGVTGGGLYYFLTSKSNKIATIKNEAKEAIGTIRDAKDTIGAIKDTKEIIQNSKEIIHDVAEKIRK